MTHPDDLLTVAEAAATIGATPATIAAAIARGRIPAHHIAGTLRVRRGVVAALAPAPGPAPPAADRVTVAIPMEYQGWAISKNSLWRGGNRKAGRNSEAMRWYTALADSARNALLAAGVRRAAYPVDVEVQCHFRDRNHAADPQNLIELIADAIEAGIGLNDRDYEILSRRPIYGAAIPVVVVRLTVGVGEDGAE